MSDAQSVASDIQLAVPMSLDKARELVKSLIYASAVLDGHAAAIGAPVTQQAIERHSNMLRSCAESVDMAVTSTPRGFSPLKRMELEGADDENR